MTQASWTEQDTQRAMALLLDMLVIPGESGHETAVAAEIEKRLRRAGLPASCIAHDSAHKRSPFGGEVGNLIVKLPGTLRRPRRLLSCHMDHVAVCTGSKPVREGDLLVSSVPGTGVAADDRGGVTIVLNTALRILREKLPHPPLTLLFTVQEEFGLQGAHYAAVGKLGKPAMGFNFDGGPNVAIAATGGIKMAFDVTGIPSHAGGHPECGVSASTIAALAIADLHEHRWLGLIVKRDKRGTSNVGAVEATNATNVVAPSARLTAECRSHDPAFRQRIVDEFRKAFKRAVRKVKNAEGRCGSFAMTTRLDYESFRLKKNAAPVVAAVEALRAEGAPHDLFDSNGGLDANWLVRHGIPTATIGAGGINAHQAEAAVDIPQFDLLCRAAMRLATDVS
jgi:tripeptide aminopeptidase